MVSLVDVNLLIALAWPSHIHHDAAHAWFSRSAGFGWATCPIIQSGFVRISSNPSIIPNAVSPREALLLLERIVAHQGHIFWPDDIALVGSTPVPKELIAGHRQVTDAYLLGLALSKRGKLATLDRKIGSLLPPHSPFRQALEILPVG